MDAEEKKLSHNPESDSYPTRQTDFRLHHFSDIPVGDPDSARVCVPLEDAQLGEARPLRVPNRTRLRRLKKMVASTMKYTHSAIAVAAPAPNTPHSGNPQFPKINP